MTNFQPATDSRQKPPVRQAQFVVVRVAAVAFALALWPLPQPALASSTEALPRKAADLFATTKVWTIHLRFTAEEWAAMEPKQDGPGPFGGGPPGAPRGGGRGGFSPSMFWAPTLLRDGDANGDGLLAREEFGGIAEKWFSAWDTASAGQLDVTQLRAGVRKTFAPPNAGAPGGGRPGGSPGRPFLLGAEGQRNGLASMMGIEFQYVHADMEFEGKEFKDVAVRYKGNGTFMESRGTLKRSLKIDLNKYVKGQKLTGLTTLNLHSNVTDVSSMNEVLSHRLYRDAGVPAPRTSYARVFVTVPGKHDKQYVGLYSMLEDIDDDFVKENFGTKKGAILKPVTPSLFADLGESWSKYQQIYDPKTDLLVDEAQRVIEFSRLVTSGDDAEFAAKLGDYLAIEEFAGYMAVTVWLSTIDSILSVGQNYYVYLDPKADRFHFVPWDLDHAFGQFSIGASQEQREGLSIHHPWRGENRFLDRVFKVEAFRKHYLAKLDEFGKTLFQPERFAQQIDEIAAAIRPAIEEESAEKLARFDKVVAGEPAPRAGFGGGPGEPFGGAPVKPIKGFVKARAQSVSEQLAGKSEGVSLDGGGSRGPGGGFDVGAAIGGVFMSKFDTDKDAGLSRSEFTQGFAGWFEKWNTDKSGTLTDEQLRAGIDLDLAPPRGGPPGGPGFGPPAGAPPPAP